MKKEERRFIVCMYDRKDANGKSLFFSEGNGDRYGRVFCQERGKLLVIYITIFYNRII